MKTIPSDRYLKKLANYCRTAPDQITEDQLRRYLLHLRNEKQFAAGSLKVAYQGIRFFFTHTVRRDWQTLKQLKVPRQRTLPAVLSREEVRQLLEAVRTPHNRAFVIAVYSLGLRLIQKYLGHSSLLNTTVYLHLTAAGEEQARVAINSLVS